ncbi:hypothetical protein NM688_g443 [Phlebia brevispora]|uniref:Uncharacterized protein n=1 Tax=Phlebia brevispora TaxID=194682 RepID=A0ACC1TEL2_9APHY|nr:hypothetical protein NM688_g443 [Phlebia brevispora]
MQWLLAVSYLAASCSTLAHAHQDEGSNIDPAPHARRKTMSFRPELPHPDYHTDPRSTMGLVGSPNDPFEAATKFILWLTRDPTNPASFYIRNDSYTDKNTGITHIYAKQRIGEWEIINGNININVKGELILSYGDSFYRGEGIEVRTTDVQSQFCARLTEEQAESQMALGCADGSSTACDSQVALGPTHPSLDHLSNLLEWNCATLGQSYRTDVEAQLVAVAGEFASTPKLALLRFMAAAVVDQGTRDSLFQDPEAALDSMHVNVRREAFAGDSERLVFDIDGVYETISPVKAYLAIMQVPDGDSIVLQRVWKFIVKMEHNWYEAAVTLHVPHRIVSVVDWVADSPVSAAPVPKRPNEGATYRVFPWGVNDPDVGVRAVEKELPDRIASPLGWHGVHNANDPLCQDNRYGDCATKYRNTTTTWGNNVFAQESWQGGDEWMGNYRPDAGSGLAFDYSYVPRGSTKEDAVEAAKEYINATITQLFYTVNKVHDLYYRYGFDEVSGNFQQHNFGRGGEENDAIIIAAQSGAGLNNADFASPPDGENPRCRMFLWNTAMPYRDGAFESGVVIHEVSHGLSTRLTGGPADPSCLFFGESGGMGEGWGDFLATLIRSNDTYSDYPLGAWVANRPGGIREYPFSTVRDGYSAFQA